MANRRIDLRGLPSPDCSKADQPRPKGARGISAAGPSGGPFARPITIDPTRSCEPDRKRHVDTQPVVTLLIEPNALMREGLRTVLSETRYHPAVLASCLDEIDTVQAPEGSTIIVIMDAVRDHDEACRQAKAVKGRNPTIRVVMLVEQYDLRQVLDAFHSGADAYLMKSISCDVFLKILDLVALGETIFPAAMLGFLRDKEALAVPRQSKALTARELIIVRCLMDGDSNKVIARKLDIAEATVKVHIKTILRKIRAKNRTQAAVWGTSHLLSDEGSSAQ